MEIDSGHAVHNLGPSIPLRGFPVHAQMLPLPSKLLGIRAGGAKTAWAVARWMVDAQKTGPLPAILRRRSGSGSTGPGKKTMRKTL